MKIKEILHNKKWSKQNEFLQSWEYGEFLSSVGRDVHRYSFQIDSTTIVQLQTIHQRSFKYIKSIYIPRCYIPNSTLCDQIFDYFKSRGFTFVRIEPSNQISTNKYLVASATNRQPHNTWILDISSPEADLLAAMHAKTRYNIRLAERKGVKICEKKDLELFWRLNTITTQRNKYVTHPKSFVATFLKQPNVYQFNATYNDNPIASAIMLKYDSTLYYIFGASSDEYRNIMAPYLLHYRMIEFAKTIGCDIYDFWGIAPPKEEESANTDCYHGYCWNKNNPLAGVSRFKSGFGGSLKSYPEAQDFILRPISYYLYSVISRIRKSNISGHPAN